MLEIIVVCGTVLVAIVLVLRHLTQYGMKRKEFEAQVLSSVKQELAKSTDYRKDLEVVNSNQLKLGAEIESVKKMIQMKTSIMAGRPPGSIV